MLTVCWRKRRSGCPYAGRRSLIAGRYVLVMPIIPLYGHAELRERLFPRIVAGTLPRSILLHGPAGVGKQRLALWIGQALLCTTDAPPCGHCRECRYALELTHPDLTWVF